MTSKLEQLVAGARAEITEIDVRKAQEMLAEGVVFIDVREPDEHAKGVIEGALTIPRGVLEWSATNHDALADRDQPIVVYCQSGGRSAFSALALGQLGFSNVYSLAGGYAMWTADE